MQDFTLVYFATGTTCEITTRIFKEYFRVFYPCCTQEESSRLWKVDLSKITTSIPQGGYVNYQPVLHHANLVKNLCFVCWGRTFVSFAHNLWTFTWFEHFELPFRLKGTDKIHSEGLSKFHSNICSILFD